MSNPEAFISSQEPVVLPMEDLVESDDSTVPDDDVPVDTNGDEPGGAGDNINIDPDMGIAESPDEVDETGEGDR